MSGFEIVGVVLAVVPICTAVITAYDKTVKAVISFKEWRFSLQKYVRQLRRQKIILRLTVKELLMEVSKLSRSDIDQMFKDRKDARWTDTELYDSLRVRYPDFYPEFETYVNETMETLKRLLHLLGLSKTQNMTFKELDKIIVKQSADSGWHLQDRVKLSMNHAKIAELFAELDRCQKTIDAIKVKDQRVSLLELNNCDIGEKPFQAFRQHAKTLHAALTKLLQCNGHIEHKVGLQVELRLGSRARSDSKVGASSSYHRFRLVFSQPRGWQRGEAHICENVRMLPTMITPLQGTQVEVKDSLCPALVQHSKPTDFLGFHIDPQTKDKVRGIYQEFENTAERHTRSQSAEMVSATLGSLLEKSTQARPQFTFSVRMAVAALLTALVRRLHTTDWLSNSLDSSQIVFVGRLPQQCTDLSNMSLPFFVQSFSNHSDNSTQRHWNDLPTHSRKVMRKIGIILMELYFGETIENYGRRAMDEQLRTSDCDYLDAWVGQRGCDLPDRYLAAVKMCNALDQQSDALAAHALSEMESNLAGLYESGR